MQTSSSPGLAVVTGASSGIGFELARCCARDGYDLVVAADRPLEQASLQLRGLGVRVTGVQVDLSTEQGVQQLYDAIGGRRVELLLANAGHGLGHGFLDQEFSRVRHVIDTNITGTVCLLHKVARDMRDAGGGRILVTGSIAGYQPGSFQAVYNGTKAFVDSFCAALRDELKGTGVTLTCLMPGVTDTEFFERAGMLDTKIGAADNKADPAEVARIGYQAMLDGEADVVAGFKNKMQVIMSKVLPSQVLASQHRKMAEPGSASD